MRFDIEARVIAPHPLAVFALACLLVLSSGTPAFAEVSFRASTEASLDELSGSIMSKEIELMQMTARFRLNNPRETPAHKWAIALLSTAAYSVVDAGNIVTFTNSFRFHTHPQDFKAGRAQSGPFLIFLGELFFLARTTAATAIDIAHAVRVRDRGFDKATFEHRAVELHGQIRQLLGQREPLAAAEGGAALQEQQMLRDLAAESDREFIDNYARAGQMQAFRFWDNALANATSGTGVFAGALPTYLGGVFKRPRYTGPGGIGFIVSGGFFASDVAVARLISWRVERFHRRRLESRLQVAAEKAANSKSMNVVDDLKQLSTVASKSPSPLAGNRLKGYALMVQSIEDHNRVARREDQRYRRNWIHDQIWNSIEGGANLAAGAVLANAGFRYNPGPNPLKQYFGARHFLTRLSWGAVTFTPSASGGIIDTPGEAFVKSWVDRKDCHNALCPETVLNNRLSRLDEAAKLAESR